MYVSYLSLLRVLEAVTAVTMRTPHAQVQVSKPLSSEGTRAPRSGWFQGWDTKIQGEPWASSVVPESKEILNKKKKKDGLLKEQSQIEGAPSGQN